jgi:hypothetical protein
MIHNAEMCDKDVCNECRVSLAVTVGREHICTLDEWVHKVLMACWKKEMGSAGHAIARVPGCQCCSCDVTLPG